MKSKETKGEERNDYLSQAETYYKQCLDYRWTSRRYFECAALTGLVRVKFALNEIRDAVDLFVQAEQIAEEHQYHNLLASLHLTKGHIQWSGPIESWSGGFDAVALSYKRALLHALKFNRFLLSEVLWGDQVSTPTVDIIAQCLLQRAEGQTMLAALTNWWESGKDDFTLEISNNVTQFEVNIITLIEAERLVRHREPGDGTIQLGVIQILKRFLV
jgi:hypothetical protein